jgi:hypothetical protein
VGQSMEVVPKDGVRRRFHALIGGRKLHVSLDSDRFAKGKVIAVNESLSDLRFELESDNPDRHSARLRLAGGANGRYAVRIGDQVVRPTNESAGESSFDVPVSGGSAMVQIGLG